VGGRGELGAPGGGARASGGWAWPGAVRWGLGVDRVRPQGSGRGQVPSAVCPRVGGVDRLWAWTGSARGLGVDMVVSGCR
jgi:hypothetical protein